MATAVAPADVLFLKNTQILVSVDEALADMLVVSYFNQNSNKRFQGVLLDSTKRNLPFGVTCLNPVFQPSEKLSNSNEDKLFSASQRFSYQDPEYSSKTTIKSKTNQQKSKMTVRLRPRKVLCSNCMGICNENSENVADTGRRKTTNSNSSFKEKKVYLNADPRSRKYADEDSNTNNIIMGSTLIPKISRLHPNEINNAMNGNSGGYNRNEIWLHDSVMSDSNSDRYHDDSAGGGGFDSEEGSNTNRRKRGAKQVASGRQEPVPDNVNGNKKKNNKTDFILPDVDDNVSSIYSSARTLKISYGEGEGTVVTIPAIISDFPVEDVDKRDISASVKNGKHEARAARKAHKKSKKQSKRHASHSPNSHDSDYQAYPRKHKKVKLNKKKKNAYKEDDSLLPATLDPHNKDPLADPLATTNANSAANTNAIPLSPPPIDVIS